MRNILYRSSAGETALADLLAQQLAAWPVEYAAVTVTTRHGETNVLLAGDPGAPPLLLLHDWGASAAALPLYYNLEALTTQYWLIMPDIPGQPGRSATTPPKDSAAYGAWASDILDALDVREVFAAGSAGGGDVVLRLAAHAPFRVIRALVTAPSGLVSMPLSLSWLAATLPLRFRPSRENARRVVRALSASWRALTPAHEHHARQLALTAEHTRPFSPPPTLTKAELTQVSAPVCLMLGANDPTLRAQAAAERARTTLLNAEVELLADHAHLITLDSPGRVELRMYQFFASLG